MITGLQTAFNPFCNANISMSKDGSTDQYQIRAVLETDCVVVNPNNLAFIPTVKPSGYFGGRGTKFLADNSKDYIANVFRSTSTSEIPSFISTVVSPGIMPCLEQPVSFINSPPGKLNTNQMDDAGVSQHWPGFRYYAMTVYPGFFKGVHADYRMAFDKSVKGHHDLVVHLKDRSDHNHVAFAGYSQIWDPLTLRYSSEKIGTGHCKHAHMNDTGAQEVFDGRETKFVTVRRPPPTSYQ
jgi:hypothetical protein